MKFLTVLQRQSLICLASLISISNGIANSSQNGEIFNRHVDAVFGFTIEVPATWKIQVHNYRSIDQLEESAGSTTLLNQEFFESQLLFSVFKDKKNKLEIRCAPYNYVDASTYQSYVTKFYDVSLSILKRDGVLFQYRAGGDAVGELEAFSLYIRMLDSSDNSVLAEIRSFNFYENRCDYQIGMVFGSQQSFVILSRVLESFRFRDNDAKSPRGD